MMIQKQDGTADVRWITKWLLKAVVFYQSSISPAFGRRCRFLPTCSEYARTAIERFGPGRGVAMASRRLLRCRPFGSEGYDPVPSVKGEGRSC